MTKCHTGFALFAFATGLMVACGGSAVTQGNPGGGGVAGSTAAGGGASGAVASGGNGNGNGNAGSDSTLDACSLPEQPGNCDAYEPSFWHNPKTGLCEPFVYGGCGGNANRFATRDACLAACPGGGTNWGACKVDAECGQFMAGCCGACEPIDGSALIAVSSAHRDDVIQDRYPMCAAVAACAPCPFVGEYEATWKYFEPVCVSGQCSLLDIRKSALTACKTDADCRLRDGVDCCPGWDGTGYVAVSANASFCSDRPVPCPGDASIQPTWISASCQQGYCALALPTP
jgi:hypothetical protein